MTFCNSTSRASITLFWPLSIPGTCLVYIHTFRETHEIKTNVSFLLKEIHSVYYTFLGFGWLEKLKSHLIGISRKSKSLKTQACHRSLGDRDAAGERRRMSGTGLTDGCEPTAVGTENWTLVIFKSYSVSTLHCRIIPLATVAISNAGLMTLTILSCKIIIVIHLQSSVHHAEWNSNRLNSHFPLPSPSLRPSPPHTVTPAATGK